MKQFYFNVVRLIILYVILFVYYIESRLYETSVLLPIRLRCEYLDFPTTLQTQNPRFSWILTSPGVRYNQSQTAYRILVSSSKEQLKSQVGDLWDSFVVKSDESVNIKYAGKAFESGQIAYWSVKVWDQDGNESVYSDIQSFGMGLLQASDWKAKWIGAPDGLQKDIIKTLDQEEQEVKKWLGCLYSINF